MTRTPTSQRWLEIERVLDAALDLPTGERAAFLDIACGTDAELRAEVERLLRAHDRAGDFLEGPPPGLDPAGPWGAMAPSGSMAAVSGSTVADRYVVEREVGRGATATVYLARDVKHQRPVALKVLDPALALAVGVERFLREIQVTANLLHPHILPLHDSGEADGLPYYVMPFLAGESLRDRLAREGPLPVDEAVRLAREVAGALDYAHRMGVVHRDIKPGNILLEDGHAVVADFGIARALSRAAERPAAGGQSLTRTGVALGTPAYMSPEQASGEHDVGAASDVYSLGCVLHEMLTGSPPFAGLSARAVIGQHLRDPPPPVRTLRPEVPTPIERTVARALAKDPGGRFHGAAEFGAALETGSATRGPRLDGERGTPLAGARALAGRHPAPVAIAGVAALAVLALTAAVTLVARRERPSVAAPAAAIAVFPLVPAVHDTALSRLGRELVITLSASLDGVGGIRTVDALTVLANARTAEGPAPLAHAVALARRLGASSVVYGSIMRSGGRARVDLALYPTSAPGREPLARASITARPDDLTALTDSAAWGLLRQVWQRTEAPTPSLAALTTSSIPALRAFLEGEQRIVGGNWRAAPESFRRAFLADSTFWLAYWRYAFARDYNALPVEAEIRAKYRAHRGEFPERDRLLVEAGMADSLSEQYERLKAITTRFPDYWPGWWALSEHLAHTGPLFGTSDADLRPALERTLSLNPRMVSAWDHLFWVALWQRDTLLSARIVGELTALGYDSISQQQSDLDLLALDRYLDGLARSGGALRDTALAEPSWWTSALRTGPVDPNRAALGSSQYGFPRGQVELSRALLARRVPPAMATALRLSLVVAHATRGTWDSALVAMDQVVAATTDPIWPLYRYRLAVVGAWLGALDAGAAADAQRAAVARVSAQLPPASRAELAWLDGLLAMARDDAGALAAARRSLIGTDSVTAPLLGRSLAAFADALAGNERRAADSLVALEHERAEFGWSRWRSDAHPFLTAVNRLAAARWLVARGDAAAAAPLLTWHQAVLFPMQHTRQANVVVEPLAYLEQGRVAEALGRTDLARTYYQRFLWRYDAPVAAHRHLVDEARAAVSRLAHR